MTRRITRKVEFTLVLRLKIMVIIINSVGQSPSWESNRFSAGQEFPHILWNPKIYSKNKFEKFSSSRWFYYMNISGCTVLWMSKKGPEDSLPLSKSPVTYLYPELNLSSPCIPIPLPKNKILYFSASKTRSPKSFLSLRFPYQKPYIHLTCP